MEHMGAFIFWGWGQLWGALTSNFIPLCAALIAIWGVVTQRIIARRKGTIDFINASEQDRDVIAAKKKFITLASQPGGLAAFADKDKRGTEDAEAIRLILNQHELISIGIQRGILDLTIVRLFNKGAVLTCWDKAAPFILSIREKSNNPNLYCEFEQLVWWLRDTKRPKRSKWRGLFF